MAELGVLRWLHSDPRGITVAASQAVARARYGQWSNDAESRADFRALLCAVMGSCANLGPTPVMQSGEGGAHLIVAPEPAYRRDSLRIQNMLGFGMGCLIAGPDSGDPRVFFASGPGGQAGRPGTTVTIETVGGRPGTERLETGILGVDDAVLAISALWVIAVGLMANALVWENSVAAEAAQNARTQSVKSANLAAALADAHLIVDSHMKREDEKQATLPWEEGELRLLDTLSETIREASGWTPPDLKSVPDARKVSQAVSKAIESTGEAVASVGKGIENVGAGVKNAGSAIPMLALAFLAFELS